MTAIGKLDELPRAPLKPVLERARESFHCRGCPACGALKKDGHWFCYECWKRPPARIRCELAQMRPGRWIAFWLQARAVLRRDR